MSAAQKLPIFGKLVRVSVGSMVGLWLVLSLLATSACTKSSSGSGTDYWASEKAECKDRAKGTLAFREECNLKIQLVYGPNTNQEKAKKWCKCAEDKLAFPFMLKANCELMSQTAIHDLSKLDGAKLKCGTASDPL